MNKILVIILIIVAFTVGYLLANPSVIASPADAVVASVQGKAIDRISPQDHIKENQIIVTSDKITLDIKDASWSRFTDTHSMDPVLDSTANGIEIAPKSFDDVKVGDALAMFNGFGYLEIALNGKSAYKMLYPREVGRSFDFNLIVEFND